MELNINSNHATIENYALSKTQMIMKNKMDNLKAGVKKTAPRNGANNAAQQSGLAWQHASLTRKQIEAALRESEERYRRLVEVSSDAIIIHCQEKFVYINPKGVQLLGVQRPEDILGNSIWDFIPRADRQTIKKSVQQTYAGGEPIIQSEEKLILSDGRVIDVEVSTMPIRYFGKKASQIIIRDITKRKQAGQKLNKLNQMSQNMVSMMAHELRTPLTSIQGYASLLRDGDAGPVMHEQTEILDIIIRNSQRLSALAETFLDLEKMEAGILYMDKRYFNLEQLLPEVESTVRINIQNNDVQLRTEYEHELLVYGDKNQLFRVFSNLISNAIKFTGQGTIWMRATQVEGWVKVEVLDEGEGISKEDLPHIFERFYQSQHKQPRQHIEGSGLGLAIAKLIVTEHGGTIQVESKLHEGSTFTVLLPLGTERRQLPRSPAQNESVYG